MKWVLSNQSSEYHRWQLRDASEPALFTYHLQNRSVRIKAKTARLFFLEIETVFFHKKVLLRSEYGIAVGEAQFTTAGKTGALVLDDQNYFYCWEDRYLLLYNHDKSPLLQVEVERHDNMESLEPFAFVFGSVWLALCNVQSKNIQTQLVA